MLRERVGEEDEQRLKTHSIHSPAFGNIWLDDNNREGNYFLIKILEVTHVFAVSGMSFAALCDFTFSPIKKSPSDAVV